MELSAEQAAQAIKVSKQTIHTYVSRGLLLARREGIQRRIRIKLDDLRSFAEEYGFNVNENFIQQLTN